MPWSSEVNGVKEDQPQQGGRRGAAVECPHRTGDGNLVMKTLDIGPTAISDISLEVDRGDGVGYEVAGMSSATAGLVAMEAAFRAAEST